MINKVINYIKNNKLYILVMVLGSLCLMLQMKFVVLYADDLFLGVIAKQGGLKGAIKHLIENYLTWGGGPTPFIAIIFLMFRIGAWKIFNCVMIIIMIILTVRMITYRKSVNKGIVALCMWLLIYVLNIFISAETLYWLDGNLAYVLTTFQMFIYFYYLYSRIIMKTKTKKYDYVILPIFAFFAGWSGPQAGALTVLIPIVLFAWIKFRNKEKVKAIYIISWVIGLIGFLVYYLAPGNTGRAISSFPEFTKYNIIEKVLYRIDSLWNLIFNFKIYHFASISFYLYIAIGFMSAIAIKRSKQEQNRKIALVIKVISVIIILFLGINFATSINCDKLSFISENLLQFKPLLENFKNGTFRVSMLIPYIVTSIILASSVVLSYYISYKDKTPLLFIIFTCSLLGQMMMLLSPYSPLRSTFITVALLWVSISYLINNIIEENVNVIGIFSMILAMTYDIKIVIVLLFLYFILKNIEEPKEKLSNKKELILIAILFIIIAISIYLTTLKGYYANQIVYYENLSRIEEFKKNPTEDNILYLKPKKEQLYGFTGFVGEEWIEVSVKQYFGLDENVILKYEVEE